MSLDIPVGAVAVVFVAGTLVHIVWTCFLLMALTRTIRNQGGVYFEADAINAAASSAAQSLFDAVRSADNIFLRDMMARVDPLGPGSKIVRMPFKDPTTWLSFGLLTVVVAAILPWYFDGGLRWDVDRLGLLTATAVVVTGLNWWAGGLWARAISRITIIDKADDLEPFDGGSVPTITARWLARSALVIAGLATVVILAYLALS